MVTETKNCPMCKTEMGKVVDHHNNDEWDFYCPGCGYREPVLKIG